MFWVFLFSTHCQSPFPLQSDFIIGTALLSCQPSRFISVTIRFTGSKKKGIHADLIRTLIFSPLSSVSSFTSSSIFTSNAAASSFKSLKLSQSPRSILLIFDWLKPTNSPSRSCDNPFCLRYFRTLSPINYITFLSADLRHSPPPPTCILFFCRPEVYSLFGIIGGLSLGV